MSYCHAVPVTVVDHRTTLAGRVPYATALGKSCRGAGDADEVDVVPVSGAFNLGEMSQ